MSYKWHSVEPGIRYREHPSRKHGIKPDMYFVLRIQIKGKRQEEALGWASEGITLAKARIELARLKEAVRLGEGPTSLREKRQDMENAKQEAINLESKAKAEEISLNDFWEQTYLPNQQGIKTRKTILTEVGLYTHWLKPIIGEIPLKGLLAGHLDNIVNAMLREQKSARTIRYALALVSHIWNTAYSYGLLNGENPVRRMKKPRVDNRRMRFLSRDEAAKLLKYIRPKSRDLHDTCLIALFCGLRAGEIHGLRWCDINFEAGEIFIRDPKNGYNRYAYMTQEIREMLKGRYMGQMKNEYVFPADTGDKRRQISKLFDKCVQELGFNDGYDDRRQKVVFHTLRHTFASWHVEQGTPLYQVGMLMGHRTPQMTERYSHLSPATAKRAALSLEGTVKI